MPASKLNSSTWDSSYAKNKQLKINNLLYFINILIPLITKAEREHHLSIMQSS